MVLCAAVALGACRFDEATDDPLLWPEPRRAPPDAGLTPDPSDHRCAPSEPSEGRPLEYTQGLLEVRFETQDLPGQYAPRNVGAVWIEDASYTYVRTLEVWAESRRSSVTMWDLRRCPKDTSIDAVASATLDEHAQHEASWDTRDFKGSVVPDGEYVLWLQVSSNEIVPEGPYIQIPFLKRAGAWKLTHEPIDGFSGIELRYAANGQAE